MSHKQAILYGLLVWVFPFIVAMLAFSLRGPERPLFESVMAVSLASVVVFASARYFKSIKSRFVWIGFCLGLIWLLISLGLDALFFSWGPMKMSLGDYLKDIGVTYLMIPVITTGIGWALKLKND